MPVDGFFHLTACYRFLSETMTATRTPKAIISDNASYVLMLSPPIRIGIGGRPSATSAVDYSTAIRKIQTHDQDIYRPAFHLAARQKEKQGTFWQPDAAERHLSPKDAGVHICHTVKQNTTTLQISLFRARDAKDTQLHKIKKAAPAAMQKRQFHSCKY